MGTPFDAEEITAIRANTPGCHSELIHLNHAGSSQPDQRILDVQIDHLRREAEIGGYEAAAEVAADESAVYDSIARLIGADRHDVARMEHATAAWNAAFWSIPMRAGQRIVTHDHDYGANWIGFLRAVELHDVVIERIPSDATGVIDVAALERVVTDHDVALVSLAWIPTSGGLVNPAAAVGEVTRRAGVPFLLDACQAVGQVDIDVHAIGCDFLSATGRKFLRGPRGSGFLYAAEFGRDGFVPSQPDHHGADWTALDAYELAPGAARFEYWEYSHATWLGLGAAVDVALDLGVDRIAATIAERARRLRAGLTAAGIVVHDPIDAPSGIVTASHPDIAAPEFVAALHERGINTSATFAGSARAHMVLHDLPEMLRLSVHCTNTVDEIDRCVAAVADVLASRSGRTAR